MRWFWSSSSEAAADRASSSPSPSANTGAEDASSAVQHGSDLLAGFTSSHTLISTAILTATTLLAVRTWRRHLRRVPNEAHLDPLRHLSSQQTTADLSAARKTNGSVQSLFGRVTSVGDADNFRLYHTPGGRLAGFHWLRRVPSTPRALRNQTLHVRIAGIDAPELAHFGRPAQPHSDEALAWLRARLDGRDVRVWLHRRDQYGRVVGSAALRRGGLPGLPRSWMRDVGLDMIEAGWATVYEAKFGAEFGGREPEYRRTEQAAQRARRGMWGGSSDSSDRQGVAGRLLVWLGLRRKEQQTSSFESPRQYKTRIKAQEEAAAAEAAEAAAGANKKKTTPVTTGQHQPQRSKG